MLIAVAAALATPLLRSPKLYSTRQEFAGSSSSWMYGTVHSCTVARGPGIPTMVFGNAGSEFSSLGMDQLPFALILTNEISAPVEIVSNTEFRDDVFTGPVSTTTLSNSTNRTSVTFSLFRDSLTDPPAVDEALRIDGKLYDLTNGRLFLIDGRLNVQQENLLKIDRSILPRYLEGECEKFVEFLDWWKSVSKTFAVNAG